MRKQKFDEEAVAREIVSESLGVAVELFDDNSRPRMVDAIFSYSDGRTAALEIVIDQDFVTKQQWERLAKDGHTFNIDGLSSAWYVSIGPAARVDALIKGGELSQILSALEATGRTKYYPRRASHYPDTEPAAWEVLAINSGVSAGTLPTLEPGTVMMNQAPYSGTGTLDPAFVATWASRFMKGERGKNKSEKLRDHSGVDERHAFIWTVGRSDMGVQAVLMEEVGLPPNSAAPDLPDGVSHLWIAGMMSSQGAIAWSPDRGWWRSPWSWNLPEG